MNYCICISFISFGSSCSSWSWGFYFCKLIFYTEMPRLTKWHSPRKFFIFTLRISTFKDIPSGRHTNENTKECPKVLNECKKEVIDKTTPLWYLQLSLGEDKVEKNTFVSFFLIQTLCINQALHIFYYRVKSKSICESIPVKYGLAIATLAEFFPKKR